MCIRDRLYTDQVRLFVYILTRSDCVYTYQVRLSSTGQVRLSFTDHVRLFYADQVGLSYADQVRLL